MSIRLPLDQTHLDSGHPCPICGSPLRAAGLMDGAVYQDRCSRPWYECEGCGEEFDGDTALGLEEMAARDEEDLAGYDNEEE